jgi:hypothetical protein
MISWSSEADLVALTVTTLGKIRLTSGARVRGKMPRSLADKSSLCIAFAVKETESKITKIAATHALGRIKLLLYPIIGRTHSALPLMVSNMRDTWNLIEVGQSRTVVETTSNVCLPHSCCARRY